MNIFVVQVDVYEQQRNSWIWLWSCGISLGVVIKRIVILRWWRSYQLIFWVFFLDLFFKGFLGLIIDHRGYWRRLNHSTFLFIWSSVSARNPLLWFDPIFFNFFQRGPGLPACDVWILSCPFFTTMDFEVVRSRRACWAIRNDHFTLRVFIFAKMIDLNALFRLEILLWNSGAHSASCSFSNLFWFYVDLGLEGACF